MGVIMSLIRLMLFFVLIYGVPAILWVSFVNLIASGRFDRPKDKKKRDEGKK